MTQGVVLVASMSRAYYDAAIRCAVSIKDYAPDVNITLFTHASFVREADKHLFDNIVTNIPVHIRAKLWALPKTPYDVTLYLDADMEVYSDEFVKVFDQLKDADMAFTNIRPHVSKDVVVKGTQKLKYHGGIFLYRKNDVIDQWWDEYCVQFHSKTWPYEEEGYSKQMRPWDQFTLWRLLKDNKDIKVGHLGGTDDYRWNYIHLYDEKGIDANGKRGKDPIIYHHTLPPTQVNNKLIAILPGSPDTFE
jgi:hypothetical protein